MHMSIAVIPARGGSKRIKRKNIRPFLGVPLLTRTIAMLRETQLFARIIVSTDDDEIAELAVAAGGEVPFRRPERLSDDRTGTAPVVVHAIEELLQQGSRAAYVCCVYPSAVLATAGDIRDAFDSFSKFESGYVFAATSYPYPIQRALRPAADGFCDMFWPEYREARSQDLEPAFHDAGMFYWGRTEEWLSGRRPLSGAGRMHVLPHYRVQDIDTEDDWLRAELIARNLWGEAPPSRNGQ
jgi:N-acylneuraminate cytidylyltransferase